MAIITYFLAFSFGVLSLFVILYFFVFLAQLILSYFIPSSDENERVVATDEVLHADVEEERRLSSLVVNPGGDLCIAVCDEKRGYPEKNVT